MKKNITMHSLEETLDKLIQEKAKALNLSLEKTIKKLLKDSLGTESSLKFKEKRRKEFMDLFGVWVQSDLDEFLNAEHELSNVQLQD